MIPRWRAREDRALLRGTRHRLERAGKTQPINLGPFLRPHASGPSMSPILRRAIVLGSVMSAVGCASHAPMPPAAAGPQAIEGAIASIDTAPWAYDGNAVIVVDTSVHGQVAVQLPARWNLCQASPVDVEALRVGMRVEATGAMDTQGELVVCQDTPSPGAAIATHRTM